MPQSASRTARIQADMSGDQLEVVERAAEIQGRTLSEFVVHAAQEVARRTIEETNIVRLSVEDQRLITEAIFNPPEPNDALRRAFEAHRKLFGKT